MTLYTRLEPGLRGRACDCARLWVCVPDLDVCRVKKAPECRDLGVWC